MKKKNYILNPASWKRLYFHDMVDKHLIAICKELSYRWHDRRDTFEEELRSRNILHDNEEDIDNNFRKCDE